MKEPNNEIPKINLEELINYLKENKIKYLDKIFR